MHLGGMCHFYATGMGLVIDGRDTLLTKLGKDDHTHDRDGNRSGRAATSNAIDEWRKITVLFEFLDEYYTALRDHHIGSAVLWTRKKQLSSSVGMLCRMITPPGVLKD